MADDPEARSYAAQLEARCDSHPERQMSSGTDLAAELERFLRDQRRDEP